MNPHISISLLTVSTLLTAVTSILDVQTCRPLPASLLRSRGGVLHRSFDQLFHSVWLLDAEDVFGSHCCGDLFSCTDRSATCLQCGQYCDPFAGGFPGCPNEGDCVPFGNVCDGHVDCDATTAADESNCDVILDTFRLQRRRALTSGEITVHGIGLPTCAAICFYHENCPFFSYAEYATLDGIVIETRQASQGRALRRSVCVMGCADCGVTPLFNATSDLYRVTSDTHFLRRRLATDGDFVVAAESPPLDTVPSAGVINLPRFPECGRDLRHVSTFSRIVGGEQSHYGEHPWQVQIRAFSSRTSRSTHVCGGVILTNRIVLTAAHCMARGEDQYEIVVGQYDLSKVDSEEQVFGIQSRIKHPSYNPSNKLYDICVILVSNRRGVIRFSPMVRPACMPSSGQLLARETPPCVAAGWGVSDDGRVSGQLRALYLPLVSDSYCSSPEVYGAGFSSGPMLCAGFVEGGADTCQGDSGGGLMCPDPTERYQILTGLVSKGGECGAANKPGVYTNIYHMIGWIENMISVMMNTPTSTT